MAHRSVITQSAIDVGVALRGEDLITIGPVIDVDGTDQLVIGTALNDYLGNLELTQAQAQDLHQQLGRVLAKQAGQMGAGK